LNFIFHGGKMSKIIPHYIGGKEIISKSKSLPILNPASGEQIAELYCANQDIINQALDYATQAQSHWKNIPPIKRAKIFRTFAKCVEDNETELAHIITLEHGKTIADAKASIQRGIEIIDYYSNIQQQLQGTFSHHVSHQVHATTLLQPLGICAGIAPFNFPVMVPLWMLIPAIACGNAFILKPSEKTPSASLKLIQWLEKCGLPPGIAQCIQGDAQTVQHLLESPQIHAFTAVGSTTAAKHIYTEATKQGKRAATFGGAKNHAIVMPDANLEHAANSIVSAAFGSSGQRCMALSAVITTDDLTANRLIEQLKIKISTIKVGNGFDDNVDMGPVISAKQLEFLNNAIEQGINEGAKLIVDGRTLQISPGYFLGPTLFDEVSPNMTIYQKELFGPILVILRMSSFEKALQVINDNPYGNGAVIFTQNGNTAQKFIDDAQAGMIGINIPVPVPIASHPFGGWKQSSFGSSPMHGMNSIDFYTKQKSITSTWPNEIEKTSFSMPHH